MTNFILECYIFIYTIILYLSSIYLCPFTIYIPLHDDQQFYKMSAEIEDTYAEAFEGCYSEILVTAKNKKWLSNIVNCATGYATSTIGCGCEAGVDLYLKRRETPDGRVGVLLQFWIPLWKREYKRNLEHELIHRIGQCILTAPTASVFNATDSKNKFAVGKKIGFFGDGYQREEKMYGRNMIVIPTMMGEFLIEDNIGFCEGVMGGNLWFMGDSENSALSAAEMAVDAISKIKGVITSFPGGICASGSKVGSKYKFLTASTNHRYCPSLKYIVNNSLVPDNVNSISEIIINGINEKNLREAMKKGIMAGIDVKGLIRISAGNYGGKLGNYRIYLKKIINDL